MNTLRPLILEELKKGPTTLTELHNKLNSDYYKIEILSELTGMLKEELFSFSDDEEIVNSRIKELTDALEKIYEHVRSRLFAGTSDETKNDPKPNCLSILTICEVVLNKNPSEAIKVNHEKLDS